MFLNAIAFLLIFLAAIAQVSLLPNFLPSSFVPDPVLILIIFWAVRERFEGMWGRAVFAGMILDAVTFQPIGIHSAAFAAVAFGVSSLAKRFLVSQKAWKFSAILAFAAFGSLVNFFITHAFFGAMDKIMERGVMWIIWNMLSNVILFSMLYWPLLRLEKVINLYSRKVFFPGKL